MHPKRLALLVLSIFGGLLLAGSSLALVSAAPAFQTRTYPGVSPCDDTLQKCIDGSSPGDVISITAGTYTQSFNLDQAVSLLGAGADQTILKALPFQRVMTVTYTTTQNVLISNLTIAGGDLITASAILTDGTDGGGAAVHSPVSIAFDGVTFQDNQALSGGGLSAGISASVTVSNSRFINNIANDSAGLGAAGYASLDHSDFVGNSGGGATIQTGQVNASRFERNTGRGGLTVGGDVTITSSSFLTNSAFIGGGLQVDGAARLSNDSFQANQALLQGGGAYFGGSALVSGVTATGNLAGDGGAFFFSSLAQNDVVTNSVLAGNGVSSTAGTAGIVFGYGRVPSQTQDTLANTVITGPGTPGSRALQVGLGRTLQQSGNTLSGHTVNTVNLGPQAALLAPTMYFTETGPGLCPGVVTYTRPITIWYGSTYANGVPVLNVASPNQPLENGGLAAIFISAPDARVGAGLVPWTDFTVASTIQWELSSTVNLDAEHNLRTALASAWLPAPYTRVQFSPAVSFGTDNLTLSTFDDFSPCTLQTIPNTLTFRHNIVVARVSYFELDATAIGPIYLPFVHR